jgi:uncharacterized protein (DUF2147 family)
MRAAAVALGAFVAFTGAGAAQAAEVFGIWLVESEDAHVEIYRCTDPKMGAVCGRVVWLKGPVNPDKSIAPSVEEVHDVYNSDPKLRGRKLLNLDFMWDFKPDPDHPGSYIDGHIYNAQDGDTYRAKLTLKNDNELVLRGYVLMPLLGESQIWTRVK